MPDGDRGFVSSTIKACLVGLILLACGIAIWDISARNTRYDQRADYRAGQHASNAQDSIERECVGTPAAIKECVEKHIRAQHESQRAEHDLSAQQAMADWALGVLAVSFVTLLATVAGVMYVRWTLHETRRIGQAQVRAYMTVGDFSGYVNDKDGEPKMGMHLVCTNTGQSPALNVRSKVGWASDPPPFNEEWHATSAINSAVRSSVGAGASINTKAATNKHKGDPNHSLTRSQIVDVIEGRSIFWAFGVIDYDDVFGRGHRMRFRYQMRFEDGKAAGFTPCEEGDKST